MVKPEHFYAKFDEEWKSWENVTGPGVRGKCSEPRGELGKSVVQISPPGPSFFGDEDAAFLPVEAGHLSRESLMTCFRGDGQKVLPEPAVSQIPSA